MYRVSIILTALLMLSGCGDFTAPTAPSPPQVQAPEAIPTAHHRQSRSDVPDYAVEAWRYVHEHGQSPEGFEGGRTFGNYEGHLPDRDDSGKRIRYQEWDVHPHEQRVNRGAERVVTGSDGSAWYTGDHYQTFIPIRE